MEALGAVDETNDALGLAAALSDRDDLRVLLLSLQSDLFALGADLASPEGVHTPRIDDGHVARVVAEEDRLEAALPPLRRFILPGGTPTAAALQLARSIARRAERAAWRAGEASPLNPKALVYLNRLSDLLFLLAREENLRHGTAEPEWRGRSD